MNEYSSLTVVAINAALHAGIYLKKHFEEQHIIKEKKGRQNLVTLCDTESEEMIINEIKKVFPSHQFLAEEGGKSGKGGEILWIIDPLDGTVNFAHGIPIFSVSIAAYKKDLPLCGVIYQPITQELFISEKGKGAFLNGKRLSVSSTKNLKDSFLATGFPYDLYKNPDKCIERFANVARKGIPIRRIGAATLDLAYVAAGRFDAFWETGLGPWDCAAGVLMVEEANGKVSNWNGKSFQMKKNLIASNGHIHKELLEILTYDS